MGIDCIGRYCLLLWCFAATGALAASLEAPPGLFRPLDDGIVGDALLIDGKQLFIDDYIIEELDGVTKSLNQPVKHPGNPLISRDRPWEGFAITYGTVVHDPDESLYKMWYQVWAGDEKDPKGAMGYATSPDGISWEKPIVNEAEQNNLVFGSEWVAGPAVFRDSVETDPARRFKMLYSAKPDGTSASLCTSAAYSADGIHWQPDPQNPLIPFSDTQSCPYWDGKRGRYVAYLRFGPPNTRLVSRIESEDFVHWSPKVTVLPRCEMDAPFDTKLYGMRIMPYEGVYVGLLTAYHGETIQPIPEDKPWMDKSNVQLTFSRNGLTWARVGKQGTIPHGATHSPAEWQEITEQATFIPYGEHKKDWDWGQIYAHQGPLVVGDEIRIYYTGIDGRHWNNYHGDTITTGVGLATLRLDGFVSIDAEGEGTLTTKPLVFVGDALEVNADARNGSVLVEVLDAQGNVIDGFGRDDCTPLTTDTVHHVLEWSGSTDCHLVQARPIKLRFYLKKARLYSFEPRIRQKHYVPSYD